MAQGFADQNNVMALNGIQSSVTTGFANAATQLCNCCSDMQQTVSNGFSALEASNNARQMANMQQAFAAQTAMAQGFNGVQSQMAESVNGLQAQLASCCCENRLATANQTATILAEHCSDRAALSDGVRDIIASQTASTQRILDQLCQDRIDAKNEEIQSLRTQLQVQNLAASQTAQTAQILADNARQTQALEQYLNPTPIPAYQVANPNCCTQNYGCGCMG